MSICDRTGPRESEQQAVAYIYDGSCSHTVLYACVHAPQRVAHFLNQFVFCAFDFVGLRIYAFVRGCFVFEGFFCLRLF